MVTRVLICAALCTVLAGCTRKSEKYCGLHPTDLENCGYTDAGIDARPSCTTDLDCAAGAPHCEPSGHYCVECYENAHCVANADKTFCDLDTFQCSSCVTHADCASQACLPSGICGDDSDVAYVDPQAPEANVACSVAAKCNTIAKALATNLPFLKLQGAINEAVTITTKNLTILADPGTTLSNLGLVLSITGSSTVTIHDLTIIGDDEKGIYCEKSTLRLTGVTITGCNHRDRRALEAKMGSTLLVSRSRLFSNAGGGILTDGTTTYQVTNTFLYRNGEDGGAIGAADFQSTNTGVNMFEMNTVVDNRAKSGAVGGIDCGAAVAAPNNIVARNYSGGLNNALTSNAPALGGCNFADSLVTSDATQLAFVMPDGAGPWDYHVSAGSMAINRGVASTITIDFDGDVRPDGTAVELGADEYKE
jgi:hypothetical protein